MKYTEIRENIIAMDRRAREGNIYLRINNIQDPTKEIFELRNYYFDYFNGIGINAEQENNFPHLLRMQVKDKAKIVKNDYYQKKQLTFQEKASAASVYLLDPENNETIIDLCAAPGIKTSLLAQMVSKDSRIIAGDFHITK